MTTEQNTNTGQSASGAEAAIIVFGRDGSDKPHASKFTEEQRQEATMAAAMMGFQALAVEGDALTDVVAGIAVGKVFASGKGFVPFVKREVAETIEKVATDHPEQLIALPVPEGADDGDDGTGESGGDDNGDGSSDDAHKPKDWADIREGSRVLAVDNPDDGWWEAIVTNVHESGTKGHPMPMLTVRWEHFPDDDPFVRHVKDVCLIHPES